MKFLSTYTFKRLAPVAGLGLGSVALGVFAYSVPTQPAVRLIDSSQSTTQSVPLPTELPNVTVNGSPLQLDNSGQASVQTPDGATVNVTTDGNKPSITSTVTSGQGSNVSTETVQINTGGSGVGSQQSSSSSTTRVQVFGNSSTSSSSSSRTTVRSNGESEITISN